jgi:hypothetical protein
VIAIVRHVIPVPLIHHWLLLHWPSVAAPVVGVLGILIAIVAQALSPEEEHAVRAARLGQGLPAAERAGHPEVTVRTRRPMPAA